MLDGVVNGVAGIDNTPAFCVGTPLTVDAIVDGTVQCILRSSEAARDPEVRKANG